MKKLSILMINTTDYRGGASAVCFSLGDALKQEGYNVKYLVGYKYSHRSDVDTLNFPKRLPRNRLTNTLTLYLRHFRSFLLANDISFGKVDSLINHPWVQSADIIHIHNRHGNFISLDGIDQLSKVKKIVWTLHDVWSITRKSAFVGNGDPKQETLMSYPPMLFWPSTQTTLQKLNFFQSANLTYVAPSKWLQSQANMILKRSIKLIANGISLPKISTSIIAKIKYELSLSPTKKIAVFVAADKNADDKGIKYFADLASKFHSEFEFIWIGVTHSKYPHVKTIAYQANAISFIHHLAIADVLVHPSLGDIFGLVILQGLSLRLPVLAFKSGGAIELIHHLQTGYLAKPNDLSDLEAGFVKLTNPNFKVSSKIIDSINSTYSLSNMVKGYSIIYHELTKNK